MVVTYVTLGLVAGLASLERKGFLQAMLSRPVALGPIVGLALGDVSSGLFVGIPLELLWLGSVNVGAILPVHEALGTAAAVGGSVLAVGALRAVGFHGPALLPAVAVVAVAVGAPFALLGRRADRLVEAWNERLCLLAERDLSAGDLSGAVRCNLYGLATPFAVAFVLAPLGAALSSSVARLAVSHAPGAVPALAAGWVAFAAFACSSGAKAMRSGRAGLAYFASLGVGLALLGLAALAGGRP